MISIVCPFYNEEAILEKSVKLLLENLAALSLDWELIIVNDGSTDNSLEIAISLEQKHSRLRVFSYLNNRGRGYAIRFGVAKARGDIVVTTEIDSSWGDDIVQRLVQAMKSHPDADMVIASCNLQGGGYLNVPKKRVRITQAGNAILRLFLSTRITMYTGMTRAYKREKYLALPLDEVEKEHHLEVVRKAMAFGYTIYEIPATIEWKDHKLAAPGSDRRKSSSRSLKLIRTHIAFGIAAAPFRYILPVGGGIILCGLVFMVWAFCNLFLGKTSILLAILAMSLILFGFLLMTIGVLALQGLDMLEEIWRLRSESRQSHARRVEPD
jgi:glycosyltransferase involved in cell wall biosynthesis